MTSWTSARVARILGLADPGAAEFTAISTDSRTLPPGALFVALEGERFDAHGFLPAARDAGARGAVVREGTGPVEGLPLFAVPDTLVALGRLARERRREVKGPVVAVTGTNGKTATKEMLALTLGAKWRVHATQGNLNNLIGVPLTILGAPDSADALVVEAGANMPGEIAALREIIEPSLGVITNVGAGHTEGFGTVEGVMAEKLSLLDGVPVAVVGTEPPDLGARAAARAGRVIVAGTAPHADVRPDRWNLDAAGRATLTYRGMAVTLPTVGRHQVENATLALAAADALGVPSAAAARTLEAVRLPPGRCEIIDRGGRTILDDTYNANPASVRAALATLQAMRDDRPVVVLLGTMLELGASSAAEHERIADEVVALAPALIGAVGAFVQAFEARATELGDRLITADDPDTLGALIAGRLTRRALVLVKASRGVRLERAIPHLIPDTD